MKKTDSRKMNREAIGVDDKPRVTGSTAQK